MATTNFIDKTTVIEADWLNEVDAVVHDVFDGASTKAEARTALNVEDDADVTDAENVGSSIHGATAKATPVDADTVPLIDSAASNVLKKVTWANVKATLKTYFDTLYVALTGNQTVAGIKTFSSFPVTPSSAPTTDYQVANKKYVDDNAGEAAPTMQVFTSSDTWSRPSGCVGVIVEVQGGGGGAGRNDTGRAGGGGAGGYARKVIDVTGISSSTVTVGSGGAGRTTSTGSGSAGGDSSWADGTNTVTGSGGSAGGSSDGGFGGSATGGDLNIPGGNGGHGGTDGTWGGIVGGSACFGSSTPNQGASSANDDGGVYGSGGAANSASANDGGDGAAGVVVVTEFY